MSAEPPACEGSCLCGAVRYRVDGPLGTMSHCHCTDCRKSHAAAFSTYVDVDRAVFRFLSGEGNLTTFEAASRTKRSFCRTCGSIVLCFTDSDPDWVEIAVATLDTPTSRRPEYHIFVRSLPPWDEIRDALPRHPAGFGRGY